ncbi:glycosyltransferase family 39 protein [Myxococcota bacterium]|nr:glycosyltransferase family 39 protein [Myxococcota bacterium]
MGEKSSAAAHHRLDAGHGRQITPSTAGPVAGSLAYALDVARPSASPPSLGVWALALCFGAIQLYLVWHQSLTYATPWIYVDAGYRLYPSVRMMAGEQLFRDMFTAYPPLSYFLHLGAFELFGVKNSSVRLVLMVSQFATTALTWVLARRAMGEVPAAGVALLTVAFGVVRLQLGYTGWYVLPLTLAALLFVFRYIESGATSQRALFWAGIFAGLALGTKLRDGIWVIVAVLLCVLAIRTLRDFPFGPGHFRRFPLIYHAHWLLIAVVLFNLSGAADESRLVFFVFPSVVLCEVFFLRQTRFAASVPKRASALWSGCAVFGAGVLVVTLPWLLYYLATVGAETLWNSQVEILLGMKGNMVVWHPYGAPLGAAALATTGALVGVALALFGPQAWRVPLRGALALGVGGSPALALAGAGWVSALLYCLIPFATGVALLLAAKCEQKGDPRAPHWVALAVFNIAVPMSLHPFTDFNHWLWVCPVSFLILGAAGVALMSDLSRRGSPVKGAVTLGGALLVALALWRAFEPPLTLEARGLEGTDRLDTPVEIGSHATVQSVVNFVNANVPPDGYILELPGSFYAFATGRRQAARLDYFHVLDNEIWDEMGEIRSIEKHAPDWALVSARDLRWRRLFPNLALHVDVNYELHSTLGFVRVFKRREQPSADTGRGGLP